MDRLTIRFSNGQAAVAGCGSNCKYDHKYCGEEMGACPTLSAVYEALAKYEEAEEQGQMIRRRHMTNFEKYKDEIIKIIETSRSGIAGIKDGIPTPCNMVSCSECGLKNRENSTCIRNFVKWLYEDDGEEPDGCDGCKYEYKGGDESPCTECCSNYTSKWERRPKKTRQDEFLEHYPNARASKGFVLLQLCPKDVDESVACRSYCGNCKMNYWLQEVEE